GEQFVVVQMGELTQKNASPGRWRQRGAGPRRREGGGAAPFSGMVSAAPTGVSVFQACHP
ncbi:MAG: hypothetical protein KAX47_04915, partial [Zoogloea sp.]|nr:hypothetical protein [Zoogloea sp.]